MSRARNAALAPLGCTARSFVKSFVPPKEPGAPSPLCLCFEEGQVVFCCTFKKIKQAFCIIVDIV